MQKAYLVCEYYLLSNILKFINMCLKSFVVAKEVNVSAKLLNGKYF